MKSSSLIHSVQAFLNWAKFGPVEVDGLEGPQTSAAWNAFLDKQEGVAPVAAPIHKVIGDPGSPYSLSCIGTCFGYEDPGDNGEGAWGLDTNNKTVVAASIPIPILMATCGSVKKADVSKYTVSVIANGKTVINIQIGDEGPGFDVGGRHGLIAEANGTFHALDMTCGLCTALGLKYDANSGSYPVVWWMEDSSGNPVKLLGLDAPKKIVA